MKYILLSILIVSTMIGCTPEPGYSDSEITGNWYGLHVERSEYLQQVEKEYIRFEFNEDKSYKYKGGALREEGTWRISGNDLLTQAQGATEKRVQISFVRNDSMLLIMNDNGIPMEMMVKKE